MKPPKYLHSNDGFIDVLAIAAAVAVIFITMAAIQRVHAAEAPVIMSMTIPGHPEINSQAVFERLPPGKRPPQPAESLDQPSAHLGQIRRAGHPDCLR